MENLASESHLNYEGWHPNIWPPFTQIKSTPPPEKVISANGAILTLENGIQLIDAISSWWVTLHGHANKTIANAIYAQANELEQVIFADFNHHQAEYLSERLSLDIRFAQNEPPVLLVLKPLILASLRKRLPATISRLFLFKYIKAFMTSEGSC